jgi:hypothetical protein
MKYAVMFIVQKPSYLKYRQVRIPNPEWAKVLMPIALHIKVQFTDKLQRLPVTSTLMLGEMKNGGNSSLPGKSAGFRREKTTFSDA